MLIKEVQLRDYPYKSKRGLAERLARRYFEKNGYEVFRGYAIKKKSENYDKYLNVKKKQDRLETILIKKLGLQFYILKQELRTGIPDFFLYRKQDNDCFFAEIKMEHEQLKSHQLRCISLLESFGFKVVVLRIKSKIYRAEILMNLNDKTKVILVKQNKLRKRY